MKIAIAQVAHESNTFSKVKTTVNDFKKDEWLYGEHVIQRHSGVKSYLGGMIDQGHALGVELVPIFSATCNPSGTIAKDAYELIINELLAGIQSAGHLDALCLALHGAGVAEEVEDLEGQLLKKERLLGMISRSQFRWICTGTLRRRWYVKRMFC